MKVNIEAERARNQMTKEEVAAKLGVSVKTYYNYVKGETPIPSDTLVEMARLFRCTTDYLLGLDAGRGA